MNIQQTQETYVTLRAQTNNQICLDASGLTGGIANGSNIQLWECQGGNSNQRFVYDDVKGEIRAQSDESLCLDAWGGSVEEGASIKLSPCKITDRDNQSWRYDHVNQRIVSRTNPDMCFDASKLGDTGGIASETNMQLWSCHGGDNQKFILVDDI